DGSNAGSPVNVTTTGGVTTASVSTAALTVGSHTIAAFYSGDSTFTASSGTLPGGQTVAKASTNLALSTSANTAALGQSVTFTALIAIQAPGAGTPTGTVQFLIDGTNVGAPVNLRTSAGVTFASFSTATLAAGTHTVSAGYSGDDSFTSTTNNLV